jgi:hypothetical protein
MATSILDEVLQDAELHQAANWYLNSEAKRSVWEEPESVDGDAQSGAAADVEVPRAEIRCPQIKFQRLREIESEPTAWLSADLFPLGTLTVLAGPSGAGKTFLGARSRGAGHARGLLADDWRAGERERPTCCTGAPIAAVQKGRRKR